MKISVAVVEPVGGHGGMNPYDAGLCQALVLAGMRVSLYTCDETVDPCIPGLRFRAIYKGIYGRRASWLRAIRYLAGSLAMVSSAIGQGEKIVHLHVFQGVAPELVQIVLAKLSWRKLVLTVHDVESLGQPAGIGRGMIGRIYGLADAVIAHNETSKQELVERLGLDRSRITVIPHGNYLEAVRDVPSKNVAKSTLGVESAKRVILFFGQIKEVKGLDLLIEALPEVVRQVPEAMVVIAGRPWKDEFAKYDALIDKMGVRDRCLLHVRYVPDDQVAQYYSAADVVVLPYRRIYQSGVILQAMSYGRAVVVSDLNGMREMVVDGENGYLFSQGSKDALARALIRALREDRERAEIGARALEYVRQRHDWSQIGTKTAGLYQTLLPPKLREQGARKP